jgi:hypothetical protein
MPQIRSQSSLVIHPTPIGQHLGWQQIVTPLIIRQPRVVPYPPYPMWYNILPPFVPMDPNLYSIYYFGIKKLDSLIFGRKERYATSTTQTKSMPPVEQL